MGHLDFFGIFPKGDLLIMHEYQSPFGEEEPHTEARESVEKLSVEEAEVPSDGHACKATPCFGQVSARENIRLLNSYIFYIA